MNRRQFIKKAAIASGLLYVPRAFAQPGLMDAALVRPAGAPAVSTLLTGLTAYWPMANASDASGNGKTLNNTGSVSFANSGKINKCATFDGSTQYLLSADSALGNYGTGDFTYGFWFNTADSGTNKIMLRKGTSGGAGFWVYMSGTATTSHIFDGTNDAFMNEGSTSYNDNQWHLLLVTAPHGGTATCWIDNVSKATASMASVGSITSATGLYFGGDTASFCACKICEAFLYSRVLNSTERASLYNGLGTGAGTTFPFTGLP